MSAIKKAVGHALFSPSAAHRWIPCPGSFAWPANTDDGESSSVYADDGTASHTWGAMCLKSGEDAEYFIDTVCTLNGVEYKMDDERAGFVQVYLDKVRQLAMGRLLLVEHWIDTSEYLGEGQGGTCDAGILAPEIIIAADLKYGMGEKVDASYEKDGKRYPNEQLGLYALGLLVDALLLGFAPKKALLVVCQPRLGHIDEYECPIEDLVALGERARKAAVLCGEAMIHTPEVAEYLMNPGEKTCRWCRAKAECPKLAKFVAEEVRADFETIAAGAEPAAPVDTRELTRAMNAVPLIEQWCKAVKASVHENVSNGVEVIGSDGKPYKFVEGELGDRKWADPAAAEATLVGVLGDAAYAPRKVLTAPAAGKILDKKKTKEMWKDVFVPMIRRAPGKPVLALGSDPRPPYSGTAAAEEFDDE